MQGTRVRALVQEDPICRGATTPMRHNYRACALRPTSHNYGSPCATTTEAPKLSRGLPSFIRGKIRCSKSIQKTALIIRFVSVIARQEVLLSPLLQLEGWLQEEDSRADWLPQDQKGPENVVLEYVVQTSGLIWEEGSTVGMESKFIISRPSPSPTVLLKLAFTLDHETGLPQGCHIYEYRDSNKGSLGVYSQPVDKFSNLPEPQVSSSVKNNGTNDNFSGMIVMGIEWEDIVAGLARRMPTVNVDCLS
ncbi:hypothetical protein J1605_010850 [Eschrichtius robustus]|uniref:Uncharacterized protein n=1 Tax=Eschrichtius robustus TaxID=9764 RepID=A0AB34GM32_ESCRO|nr:hypothetical protein J1605_010850 [Eschrichtius robustus]